MDEWLKKRKGYWWWVRDVTKLDREAILEGVMNFGRWQEFMYLKNEWGLSDIEKLFKYMTKEKRQINLRPEKVALFTNYLRKYAQ